MKETEGLSEYTRKTLYYEETEKERKERLKPKDSGNDENGSNMNDSSNNTEEVERHYLKIDNSSSVFSTENKSNYGFTNKFE
jgi:hypothetical protein